jgi:hypothetical protein
MRRRSLSRDSWFSLFQGSSVWYMPETVRLTTKEWFEMDMLIVAHDCHRWLLTGRSSGGFEAQGTCNVMIAMRSVVLTGAAPSMASNHMQEW